MVCRRCRRRQRSSRIWRREGNEAALCEPKALGKVPFRSDLTAGQKPVLHFSNFCWASESDRFTLTKHVFRHD